MYSLHVLNLIMLALAVLCVILAFMKRWKLVKILACVVVIYFGSNFFFFETRAGNNSLHLHPAFWGWKSDISVIDSPVLLDGKLIEAVWNLKDRPFNLHEGKGQTAAESPSFQFLQDMDNLYIGGRYVSKSETAFETYEPGLVGFGFTMTAFFGGADKKIRLLFEPIGEEGNLSGRSTVDCPKSRYTDNYSYASVVDGNIWTFEFSVPFDEIMDEGDMILVYKLRFFDRKAPENIISYYPTPVDKYGKYIKIERR